MSKLVYFFIFLGVLVLVWAAWSYLIIRNVEQPDYQVLEENESYEVRQYKPFVAAETIVENADYSGALNEGFRRIAGYICSG